MRKILLLVTLVMFSVYKANAQKIYVVSVGIADYKEINDLRLTENDVNTFNALMTSQNAEITTLLGKEATHANIINTLRGTFAKAKPEDTMVFFFSGHGYEGGFCCWDMSGSSPTFQNNEGVRGTVSKQRLNLANRYYGGLSYAEMQILFRNCRAGKKLVIADACFSGGLRKGNHLNVSVQSARNGNVIYFLSSRTDETSLEMTKGTNGLFTFYIAKAMLGEADVDGNNALTIRELFDYVYKNVTEYANKIPHSQHPVMWGKFNENISIFNLNN